MEKNVEKKVWAHLRLVLPFLVLIFTLGITFFVWLHVKNDIYNRTEGALGDNAASIAYITSLVNRVLAGIIITGILLALALFNVVYFLVNARKKVSASTNKIIEDLRKSEKRFKDIANLLPANVYEADATGKTTFVNEYAFKTSGYTQAQFKKGMNILDVVIPEDRKRAMKDFAQILNGKSVNGEYIFLRADGSVYPILLYATPSIENGKVTGIRGVSFDISERKKTEAELMSRATELERINKLMVGREVRMIELKKEIADLKKKLKEWEKKSP